MNLRLVLGVVALVGCQSGEPPPGGAVAGKLATYQVKPLVARTAPVTPMPMLIADEPPPAASEVAAPFSLTASDGSGLVVTRVDAKAVLEGPLAFTELHLYFHNPEDRVREGTFAITLPAGAAVSRFAMEIDGRFQEAEVVEKSVARRVYDDFLHRKQDPALLEKAAGNQFTAKVFPIPPRADKHLVVSFSQDLAGRRYKLPLRGLPKTNKVDAELAIMMLDGSQQKQTLSKQDWQPDQDFTATVPPTAAAISAGELIVGTIALGMRGDVLQQPITGVTLLVDTSASRTLGFARYVASIRELVGELRARHAGLMLHVVAFDQDTQPIFSGAATDYGDAQDKLLLARGAAGASNLAQALASIASPHERVVVVTDGVMTAGPDTAAVVDVVKKLPAKRLDVVLAGGIRDERFVASIVRAGLAQAGDVFDLDRGMQHVVAGLATPVQTNVEIDIPGAVWVYPRVVPAARPGNPLMVFARMAKPTQGIVVHVGQEREVIGTAPGTRALVERAIASAEIEELENTLATISDPAQAKPVREDIAKRSVRSRVISSQTSMLVLESEADYERYKIPRTALADILVIGPQGLEQSQRATAIAKADFGNKELDAVREELLAREKTMKRLAAERSERRDDSDRRARARALEEARSAGILGSASMRQGEQFASLDATGDTSSGFADTNVYGGLLGNEADEADGSFGYGRSGFGPGGGGAAAPTAEIGTGRYGTIGHGSGTGTGYGVGGGRGGMRGRSAAVPSIQLGQPQATGELDKAIIRRYIKRNIQRLTYCYERELLTKPTLEGTVIVTFTIEPTGRVSASAATGVDDTVARCMADVVKNIEFPRPATAVQVRYPITVRRAGSVSADPPAPEAPLTARERARIERQERLEAERQEREERREAERAARDERREEERRMREEQKKPALTGKLADVMKAVQSGAHDKALALATTWHDESPGDVLALVALGEALEGKRDITRAARIYGSIIDLFPMRADMRRFAGERLERLGKPARSLVVDTYRRAVADRPDHATGHRLLAYALVEDGDHAGAFAAILAGVDQTYPSGRFRGADRILKEDAGMIGAAYIANGGTRDAVVAELTKRKLELAKGPSTRFIMYWETDANDVDFHIRDSRGGHAWYSNMQLPSGGELYADVTTGYGPECFAIQGTPTAGPYKLSINYYSQGPMGYGMGLLQIQRFDGKGFTIEDRPYVIMRDHAFVDLGTYR